MPLVPWFTATMHLPPSSRWKHVGKYSQKQTYSNGKWTMNEDDFPLEKWKIFQSANSPYVSWFFVIPLRFPWMGVTVKIFTQDSEVSQRHEDGLHATRGRPRQYQNSLRGRNVTKNGGKLAVSLDGGTPNLHPKMIIFSRKTQSCWVPPF